MLQIHGERGRRKSEGDKNKHRQNKTEKRTEINIGCARDYIALSQNV